MVTLTAAALVTCATMLLRPVASAARARASQPAVERPRGRRGSWLVVIGAALAVLLLTHGVVGVVLSVATGWWVHRTQQRRVSDATRRTELRRVLELPLVIDVMASCLCAGTPIHRALQVAAEDVAVALREDLSMVAAAMRMGADPAEAWDLVDARDLEGLAGLIVSSSVSGASLAPLLTHLSDQWRQRARAGAMDAARSLGVRATGPLGLCFLPAFVLIAVVPLVVSLVPWPGW